MKTNQTALILSHLLTGKSINPMEALKKFGCFRLASRIWDLRFDGYDITAERVTVKKKTFASYSINESYNPL